MPETLSLTLLGTGGYGGIDGDMGTYPFIKCALSECTNMDFCCLSLLLSQEDGIGGEGGSRREDAMLVMTRIPL